MGEEERNIDWLIMATRVLIAEHDEQIKKAKTKTKRYELESFQAELIFTLSDLERLRSLGHKTITDKMIKEKKQ